LFAVAVAFAVVGAIGSLHTGDLPGNGDNWSLALVSMGYAWLGWVVARRRPTLPIGWLLLLGGVANAVLFTANWWAVQSLVHDPGSLRGGAFAAWITVWLQPFPLPLVLIAPLVLFPTGSARSRRWWWFVVASCGAIAVLAAVAAVLAVPAALGSHPATLLDVPGVAKRGVGGVAVGVASLAQLLGMGTALVAVVGVIWARRHAVGVDRQAYGTVLVGALVVVATFVAGALVAPLTGQRHTAPEELYSVALLAIPAAIAVGIARFQVYELRAAVNRTVLIVLVGVSLATVYLAVLWVLAAVLDDPTLLSVPSALGAGAVVLASAPVASAVRRAMRRWLGRPDRPGLLADRLRDRVTAETDAGEALRALAEGLRDELRLGSVALHVEGLPSAVVGEADDPITRVPLAYGQQSIGEIEVSARSGEALAPTDVRFLGEVAGFLAVAAEAIRVSDSLRQAQHALETAHAEERRRVRRDLHDGIAPTLASVRLKLSALRRTSDGSGLLDDAIAQVSDTIREVRRIVDGLQPSVLEDLGLVPALQILVADVRQTADMRLALEAPPTMPELPADAANTAYRVVSEALANVMRHSRASACLVRVDHRAGMLEVEISDDGQGFDTDRAGGMGLRSIATRASLANGEASIASVPGAGTTVTVRVPA
jgi:signal transduction histidine kinase